MLRNQTRYSPLLAPKGDGDRHPVMVCTTLRTLSIAQRAALFQCDPLSVAQRLRNVRDAEINGRTRLVDRTVGPTKRVLAPKRGLEMAVQ